MNVQRFTVFLEVLPSGHTTFLATVAVTKPDQPATEGREPLAVGVARVMVLGEAIQGKASRRHDPRAVRERGRPERSDAGACHRCPARSGERRPHSGARADAHAAGDQCGNHGH